jgi:hypothetical protein
MGIVYVSFGVPRIKDLSGFFNKQLLCSTLTLIHIKKSIEPQITAKKGILVSPSIVGMSFFYYRKKFIVSRMGLSFNNSQVVLTLCSLNLMAPKLAYLELHIVVYLGPINFVERRFPRVTKSFIDKSFNKLVKKCFEIDFFKLTRSWKKSMACVNIT